MHISLGCSGFIFAKTYGGVVIGEVHDASLVDVSVAFGGAVLALELPRSVGVLGLFRVAVGVEVQVHDALIKRYRVNVCGEYKWSW